ncbi:MAG: glycosyl hydrolase family 28-related protein [Pirellulales bacterium]
MSIAIGDPVSGGTAHSILFVGPGTVLAQDTANFTWNSTDNILFVNGSGAKTGSFIAMNTGSTATSSTSNAKKTALSVNSIGTWNGTNAENRAIFASASGGPADANYAGFFKAGDVVLEDGRLGAQVLKPSARLHLAAGSASPGTAAFKLNAGAKLTTPEAGAIEFDGTYAFITRSDGTRRLLTNNLVNVVEFGAIGNGTTDDSAAVRAAIDSIVDSGGAVYFPLLPPGGEGYRIDSSIAIESYYPIFLVSDMSLGSAVPPSGYIFPGAGITDGIFVWRRPLNEPGPFNNGGGGMIRITILDPGDRDWTLDSAVHLADAAYFEIQECYFLNLRGRALHLGNTVRCRVKGGRIYGCGDSGKPAIHVAGGPNNEANNFGFAGLYTDGLISESNGIAQTTYYTHIRIEPLCRALIRNGHFENTLAGAAEPYIDAAGGLLVHSCAFNATQGSSIILGDAMTFPGAFKSEVRGSSFRNNPVVPIIKVQAQQCQLSGLQLHGDGANVEKAIEFTSAAANSRISDTQMYFCGNLDASAATFVQIDNIHVLASATTETHQIKGALVGTVTNCIINGNNFSASAKAILANQTNVENNVVYGLNGSNWTMGGAAIESSAAADIIRGNRCDALNGGKAFKWTAGAVAGGNYGYPTTAVADASGNVTLDSERGKITTDSLTTGNGLEFTITLTNSLIAAGSSVFVKVQPAATGSNTKWPIVLRVNEFAGGCSIIGTNVSGAALDGKVVISFEVVN